MKSLTSLVLASSLALGLTGCDVKIHSDYLFKGNIGGEKLEFKIITHPYVADNDNILLVTKTNGITLDYRDIKENDLKLDMVFVYRTNFTNLKAYNQNDEVGRTIISQAQTNFDNYLSKIKEIKIKQGLEALK